MKGLGYTWKETIHTMEARNVQELQAALVEMSYLAGKANERNEEIYVEDGAGENVTLRLIENTLTDGSKVYDIRIS